MGNNHSRGTYSSKYPPKHTYYSEHGRRRQKPRKGGGGGRYYQEEADYPYTEQYQQPSHPQPHQHSRYPSHDMYRPQHGYDLYSEHQPIRPSPLPFPNVAPQNTYPVIPPMPHSTYYSAPPPAVPNASYLTNPTVRMPEPAPASAPVIPPQFAHFANGASVRPSMPQGPMPQQSAYPPPTTSPAPAFPQPQQTIPVVPQSSSLGEGDMPRYDIHSGQPLAADQYAYQEPIYTRPVSPHFRHNPLPTPPKDVFELSPYVGLLKDLRRPPEETLLRRTATSPQYATGYIISPTGSYASRERKQRKGLFRSLSNALGGKHRREQDVQPVAPVYQPVVFTTAPIAPSVIPPVGYTSAVPPPGAVWPQTGGGTTPVPVEARSHSPLPPRAPPSPAPSHRSNRSHHSHHSHRRSPRPEPLRIDLNNNFAGLTHLSPHRVHYERKSYPTAFHLLEASRFIGHRPDLAEEIRMCPDPDEARAIVSQNAAHSRQDWEQIVVEVMDDVMYTKFVQHPDLRRLLLSTGAAELLYTNPRDSFWGEGPLGRGANELGRALERVRERLLSEGFTIDT